MAYDTSLLLVDDDIPLAESMADWLDSLGFEVRTAGGIADAEQALARHVPELLVTDLQLQDGDGMDLVRRAARRFPELAILVVTGYATPDTAIEAVQAGAFDLLTKPLLDDELLLAIERAVSQRQIAAENERLRAQLESRFGLENIRSHDYRMLRIFDTIDSIADARASILITGENGTGKSMIARAIHHRSSRRKGPFVEVACGALPDTLLESELFGHVTGAFTGATANKIGKFKQADSGTLFLDEIGTASQAMQVKLLRVLQEFQFEPLGATHTETVDARVVLATNENLEQAVAEGRFRQDLYYRVNVVNIELPPLRERAGDIPLLVEHFVRRACETSGRQSEGFDRDALALMQRYGWPGNVRELENVVERAVLLGRGPRLTVDDLPPQVVRPGASVASFGGGISPLRAEAGPAVGFPGSSSASSTGAAGRTLREALEQPEREIILQSLREHSWNRAATADTLGINRTTLYKKMKRLGLDDPRLQFA